MIRFHTIYFHVQLFLEFKNVQFGVLSDILPEVHRYNTTVTLAHPGVGQCKFSFRFVFSIDFAVFVTTFFDYCNFSFPPRAPKERCNKHQCDY